MNTIKLILLLTSAIILSINIFAQNSYGCDSEGCQQFDFWIGEWNAEWENQDSTIGRGTNTINSILKGCVIEENFNGNPGVDFSGKSFSVYNQKGKMWQQTWVDDSGDYMLFTGGMENDKMILSRQMENQGKQLSQRMVFYNITEDSFDWNWESSIDDGESWKLNWKIRYTRIQ